MHSYVTIAEITQEVAARGLGLTYELCDGSTKQEMVQSLVGTLMEGRRSGEMYNPALPVFHIVCLPCWLHRIEQKVTEETEIFKQGELGKAPEG